MEFITIITRPCAGWWYSTILQTNTVVTGHNIEWETRHWPLVRITAVRCSMR